MLSGTFCYTFVQSTHTRIYLVEVVSSGWITRIPSSNLPGITDDNAAYIIMPFHRFVGETSIDKSENSYPT